MPDYSILRSNMIEGQLHPSRIADPLLLDAISRVPREKFVPEEFRDLAYTDARIPLGSNRWLLEPLVLARMIQAAEIEEDDVVLDLGCASGYASAVLARLASTVVGVESDSNLAAWASRSLTDCAAENVVIIHSPIPMEDGTCISYNAILIGGAVAEIAPFITELLADRGRLVAIVRPSAGSPGMARLFVRDGSVISSRPLFESTAPFLPGFEPKDVFVFG